MRVPDEKGFSNFLGGLFSRVALVAEQIQGCLELTKSDGAPEDWDKKLYHNFLQDAKTSNFWLRGPVGNIHMHLLKYSFTLDIISTS